MAGRSRGAEKGKRRGNEQIAYKYDMDVELPVIRARWNGANPVVSRSELDVLGCLVDEKLSLLRLLPK